MRLSLLASVAAGLLILGVNEGGVNEARAGELAEDESPIRGFEVGVLGGAGYDSKGFGRSAGLVVARYFPTDDFSVGLEGGLSLIMDDDLPEAERWDEDRMSFAAQVSWIFLEGALADDGVPAYDLHLVGAIGIVSSEPVPITQTDGVRVALGATAAIGVGLRLSFTPWLSMLVEARDDVWIGSETRQIGMGRLGLAASMPTIRGRDD